MLMRLLALLACYGAAFALALPPAAAQRPPPPIVAIGDLHGDYEAWRAIAQAARLIDQRGRWSGGATILVQMGDVVDRGPDSIKIIEDLMRLQRQARRSGGQVVVLVGNHEAMMMTGDLRYVHPGEYRAFVTSASGRVREAAYESQREAVEKAARARNPELSNAAIRATWFGQVPLGMIEHQLAWSPSGRLGRWTLGNPAVARIGETLFVHGGLSSGYASLSVEEINRRVAQALAARETSETSIINDPLGPLWYRGLALGAVSEEQPAAATAPPKQQQASAGQEVDQMLAAFQVRRIVIAHTPSLRGIVIDGGGKLVRADTGISRAYGGVLSWVRIEGSRVTPHTIPRPAARTPNR